MRLPGQIAARRLLVLGLPLVLIGGLILGPLLLTLIVSVFEKQGFWIAPGVEIVPRGYFVDSANTTRTPSYTLVNVKIGYEYKPWNLGIFFEGKNLGDKRFVSAVQVDDANRNYFFPGDGRGFYGSVAWRWK